MPKPIPTLTSITATFSGITFNDTDFQFGDANQTYTIAETPKIPHQWNQAFYYNMTTPIFGSYNTYAKIYVAIVSEKIQQVYYTLFSDLSLVDEFGRKIPYQLFFVDNLHYTGDCSLGVLIPNLKETGGNVIVTKN